MIGAAYPKRLERPLGGVVPKPGEELTKEEILEFLHGNMALWWLPDEVVFLEGIPKTSVGQFSKKEPRASSRTTGCQLVAI